jgi:prevent-host-death family protein
MATCPRFRSDHRLTARPSGRRPITVAQTNLSKLVDRAAAGEEIIIAKAGEPKAKLVPYQPARKKRRFGQNLLGIIYIADDFDRPCRPSCRTISSRFHWTHSMAIEPVPSLHATPP